MIYHLDFHFFSTQHSHLLTALSNKYIVNTCLHIDVVCVSLHRPGSVLADYTISATSNSLDFGAANTQVSDSLTRQGIDVAEDAFAQSGKRSQCLI